MRGRKNAVKACEMLNESDALKVPEVLKAQKGVQIPDVRNSQGGEKTPKVSRHKTRKSRRNKKYTLASMIRAAADPKKRVVMSRVWNRRQKRLDHIIAVVRLVIRYLNARDRTTIYRNK